MARIDLSGFDKVLKKLQATQTEPFRLQLSNNCAEEARLQTAMGFRSAESPYGAAWAAHAPSRFKTKKRPGRILRSSGALQESIVYGNINRSGFTVGTSVKYARVHQFGYKFAPRQQAAVRIRPGQIMFVKEDDQWSEAMGKKKWSRILRKFGVKTGKKASTLPTRIGQVSRVFYVTVAPVIPARPFLPTNGLPDRWRSRFATIFSRLVKSTINAG